MIVITIAHAPDRSRKGIERLADQELLDGAMEELNRAYGALESREKGLLWHLELFNSGMCVSENLSFYEWTRWMSVRAPNIQWLARQFKHQCREPFWDRHVSPMTIDGKPPKK